MNSWLSDALVNYDFENTGLDDKDPKCLGTLQGRGVLLPEPGLHLAAYLNIMEDLSTVMLRWLDRRFIGVIKWVPTFINVSLDLNP